MKNRIIKIQKKLLGLSPAKKSAFVYMIGSYIQYAISFLVTPIFSRLLTTGEFGLVTTYNSWSEMIGPIATLSLYAGFFNVGMVDYEDDRDSFASSMMGLSFISTFVAMVFFLAARFFFPSLIGLPPILIVLLSFYYISFPALRYWMARERFEYRYKQLFFVTMVIAIFSPIGGLLCIFLLKGNLGVDRLIGTHLIHIILGFWFVFILIKRGRKLYNKERWKTALNFSIPLIPHYLAMHILSASDRVMINNISGSSEAGIYGMAHTATMVVTALWTAINGSLTPYSYRKIKERDFKPMARTSMICIIGFSIICFLICLVAPEVILILGGNKYAQSIGLLPPLFAAVVFMEMYNLFSIIEFYNKKTKLVMAATMTTAVINIILNYFCIKLFGYRAAAYTTLVCYILYCLFHYLNMVHIEKEKIYNPKVLLCFAVIYVILCLACLLIYDFPLIRYSILLISIILTVVFRTSIKSFYQQLVRGKSEKS